MQSIAQYRCNGSTQSILGPAAISGPTWFTDLPGISLTQAHSSPSATSSAGQLRVPGSNRLNGQEFHVLASGDFSGAAGGASSSPVTAQLGVAANYELLAAAGITNTGSSVITGGNVGSFPTPAITGFPPGVVTPPNSIDNTDAQAAQAAALFAYNYYTGLTFTSLSGSSANLSVLGNGSSASTYVAGNYSAGSSMDIPTSITLDAQGNSGALFIFKAGSTITLESNASILLVNGAQAQNVVWLPGSSFTSVAPSVMNGNILANTSITLGGGVLNGRALAGIVTTSGAITIAGATTATNVGGSASGYVSASIIVAAQTAPVLYTPIYTVLAQASATVPGGSFQPFELDVILNGDSQSGVVQGSFTASVAELEVPQTTILNALNGISFNPQGGASPFGLVCGLIWSPGAGSVARLSNFSISA
jgi:hypothetical protein